MRGLGRFRNSQQAFGIIHRFWATCRKVLDKNRLDLMASRLRFRQSNRKREIETRCHLSRLLVSETRHVKTGPKTFLENVGQKTRLDFSRKRRAKNETRFFVFVKTCSKTRITHRFWETSLDSLEKNRLDKMATRSATKT